MMDDISKIVQETINTLVFICIIALPLKAEGQITSGRLVAALPFTAKLQDRALAADLYNHFIAEIEYRLPQSGLLLRDGRFSVEESRVARILSNPNALLAYATTSGALFIISGAVMQVFEGGILVSVVLYSVDDQRILANESQIYADADAAYAGVKRTALKFCNPSRLTPSDTAVFYSLIIPGLGQLVLNEPLHAAFCAGLVAAAAVSGYGPYPYNANREELERIMAERRKKRISLLVLAWLVNLADTVILSKRKVAQVDARPFFSLIETISKSGEVYRDPIIGIRLRWFFP